MLAKVIFFVYSYKNYNDTKFMSSWQPRMCYDHSPMRVWWNVHRSVYLSFSDYHRCYDKIIKNGRPDILQCEKKKQYIQCMVIRRLLCSSIPSLFCQNNTRTGASYHILLSPHYPIPPYLCINLTSIWFRGLCSLIGKWSNHPVSQNPGSHSIVRLWRFAKWYCYIYYRSVNSNARLNKS